MRGLNLGKYARLHKWCVIAAASLVAPVLAAFPTVASAVTVSDGNTTLVINPTNPSLPLTSSWTISGVDQYGGTPAGGEQIYYAIGNTAPEPISSLTNTHLFSADGLVEASYLGSGFTLSFTDTFAGGTPSSLVEQLGVNNTSSSPLDLRLYVYSNVHVNGMAGNNTLQLTGGNTATYTNPSGNMVASSDLTPTYYQVANDTTIKDELTSGSPVTLNDNSGGPIFGNDSFAVEWEQTLPATTGSLTMSITESASGQVVPLPSAAWSALAMLAGLATIGLVRRTRTLAEVIA